MNFGEIIDCRNMGCNRDQIGFFFFFVQNTLFKTFIHYHLKFFVIFLSRVNSKRKTCINTVHDHLASFGEGIIVLGGNFNMSPDPLLDTSHSWPTHSYTFLKHFKKAMQAHLLVAS